MGDSLSRLQEFFDATSPAFITTTAEQLEAANKANMQLLHRLMASSRSRPGLILSDGDIETSVAEIELCAYCAKERTGPGKCPECGARP